MIARTNRDANILRGTRRVGASIGLQEFDSLWVKSISGWSESCAN